MAPVASVSQTLSSHLTDFTRRLDRRSRALFTDQGSDSPWIFVARPTEI